MSIVANIPRRPAGDIANDHEWAAKSRKASLVVGRFRMKRRKFAVALGRQLEVALLQTGQLGEWGPDEIYPTSLNERWAAIARDPGTHKVFGVYEFFAGPADPFNLAVSGKKLVGKAIEVDRGHLERGVATNLIRAVRNAGLRIVPDGLYTPEGAALANNMGKDFELTAPGTITLDWPPRAIGMPSKLPVAVPIALGAAVVGLILLRSRQRHRARSRRR